MTPTRSSREDGESGYPAWLLELMKLLGHESMVTSQRYVDGAGTENRAAVAQNRCTA
jgi:hypothetical protein